MGVLQIEKPKKCIDCKLSCGMMDCKLQEPGKQLDEQMKDCPIKDKSEFTAIKIIENVCDNMCNNFCKYKVDSSESEYGCSWLDQGFICPLDVTV